MRFFFQAHFGCCPVNKHREIHQEATRTAQCGAMVLSAAGECMGHTEPYAGHVL